ncbi:MAG: carboxypeptidase-like regulatory domain-containing protein, partial [Mucilaginibacter sp.]
MKKLILFTLMIAALAAFKCNSSRHITGVVYGSSDKLPIPGATVKLKGSNTATLTNTNGAYAIDVPDGQSTLVFSYIGYQSQTIAIGKTDT